MVTILTALAPGCARPAGPGGAGHEAAAPTPANPPEGGTPADLVIEEPTPAKPVTVGAALVPAKVRAGGTLTLHVQARIAPTWHIYGVGGPSGENAPTTLTLVLPKGVEPVGPWAYPEPQAAPGGEGGHYEGTVTFRRQLRIAAGAAPGPLEVTCEFGYQACDPFSCRPPAKLVLKAGARVVAED